MTTAENTQVDFYILQDQSQRSIWQFCCRLTEKVWKLGNSVHIRTNNEDETRQLDDMMWTYSDVSFLPHTRQDETTNTSVVTDSVVPASIIPASIILGHNINDTTCDLLINLASTSPEQINQYLRIAEILNDDETIKQHGRTRYSKYKQTGCAVQHHKIGSK